VSTIDLPSAESALVTPVILISGWLAMPGIPVMVSVAVESLGISRSLKVSLTVAVRATVALAVGDAATSLGCASADAGASNMAKVAMIAAIGLNFISISCGMRPEYAVGERTPHVSSIRDAFTSRV
jgi:hypothetical protein